jgi:hypothetical protein
MIAVARLSVACTIVGPTLLGTTWLTTIRFLRRPSAPAAST